MRKSNLIILGVIVLLLPVAFYIFFKMPSNKFVKYDVSNDNIIYYGGELIENHSPLIQDETIFVEIDMVREYIDDKVFYNDIEKK